MDVSVPLDARRHAFLARELIKACGGLVAAAAACRLSRSQLSSITDPKTTAFMPADVMADLEAYCGEPIYSRALVEARPAELQLKDFLDEACEASEAMVSLQAFIRLQLRQGRPNQLDEATRRELAHRLINLEREIRDVLAAGDRVLS